MGEADAIGPKTVDMETREAAKKSRLFFMVCASEGKRGAVANGRGSGYAYHSSLSPASIPARVAGAK